jgi:hypothetical protein
MGFWEFIGYCFRCLGIAFSSAFGSVPDGTTWKEILVGLATFFILVLMVAMIIFLFWRRFRKMFL